MLFFFINVALKIACTVSMELKVEPDSTMDRARPVHHLMTGADLSNKMYFSQSRLPFEHFLKLFDVLHILKMMMILISPSFLLQ